MAHLTRPAEISGVSAGSFPETAAGNRAYLRGNDFISLFNICDLQNIIFFIYFIFIFSIMMSLS